MLLEGDEKDGNWDCDGSTVHREWLLTKLSKAIIFIASTCNLRPFNGNPLANSDLLTLKSSPKRCWMAIRSRCFMLISINHLTSARLQTIKCTRFKWHPPQPSAEDCRAYGAPSCIANGDEHPIRIISSDDHKGTISQLPHTDLKEITRKL